MLLAALILTVAGAATGTIVQHVDLGQWAVLPCPSNADEGHIFQYWQIGNDHVIGPGNPYNTHKYKYEVWSGRLIIKSVSTSEAGLYKCISRDIGNTALNIQAVELVINKTWEAAYEEDPQANTYRAIVAILVLLIAVILGAFAYFAKTRRSRNFSELTREDSPDERPTTTGLRKAYNPTTTDKPSTSRAALDNAIVETDIKTSFSLTDYP